MASLSSPSCTLVTPFDLSLWCPRIRGKFSERAAAHVHGLVQAAPGAVRTRVGPQLGEDRVTVQFVPRRQRELLDERARGAESPGGCGDGTAVDFDGEPAQQTDDEAGFARSGWQWVTSAALYHRPIIQGINRLGVRADGC